MKKILLITVLIFTTLIIKAQQANVEWAVRFGGANQDNGTSCAVDKFGNVFVTGWIDLDEIFISKYSQNGVLIWQKQLGTGYSEFITVDNDGNIYTTGSFNYGDFDPGVGIFEMSATSGRDIFISKLDNDGNFIWARQYGGEFGNSLAIDNYKNVYLTGCGVGWEIYIAKIDSAGTTIWEKSLEGVNPSNLDWGESITVDLDGIVYVTGMFKGKVDFNPGLDTLFITSTLGEDPFILKLDNNGNFIWAKHFGCSSDARGVSIAIDNEKNLVIGGFYRYTADFDTGSGVYYLESKEWSIDSFISKLDTSGNLIWVKSFGGASRDEFFSMDIDKFGNIYSTGYFSATADFDPSIDSFLLIADGPEIYVNKIDKNGNFVWAKKMGGDGQPKVGDWI